MEKLNIAEILENCLKGMKLYSPIFGDVYLDKIRPHLAIVVITDKEQGDFKEEFLYDGRYGMNGECMLFPSKDKTTWEGFQRSFKDGHIIIYEGNIAIYKQLHKFYKESYIDFYCGLANCGRFVVRNDKYKYQNWGNIEYTKFATEEEKEKLFKAIKDSGYKWNPETKTLEKLIKPKFKVGDIIQNVDTYKVKITEVNIEDELYAYKSMIAKGIGGISFREQDDWELAPNKFDITTLKPFDKVLVRCGNNGLWNPQFFAKYRPHSKFPFTCTYNSWSQCVPYEGNEHLLDTTDDCNEYFKTWE
jgi:hypothetical protein